MKRVLLSFPISIVLLVGAAQCARSQDLRLNVTKQDKFATRRMQVFKATGEQLKGVFKLRGFDQGSQSFVLEDVTGQSAKVAVSDLRSITFEQTLLQPNPTAQVAASKITSKPGEAMTYKIPAADLRVDSGDIVFPVTAFVRSASQPTSAAGDKSQVVTTDVPEAKTITYDSSSKSFVIEIQHVIYMRETFGSSSLSGPRKDLH